MEVPFGQCPFATALFHTTAFPREPEYFIPVGNRQVLISLATDLDDEQIAEVAIAKVVDRISEGSTQTACILSLQHAIIVEIDKSCHPTKVIRTRILRTLDVETGREGADALIATLSVFPRPFVPHLTTSNGPILPVEITEHIFKYMAVKHPSSIPNFASACKQFAAIVSENVLRFPGCTLFPHARQPGGNAGNWWVPNLFPCVSGVDHATRTPGVFYVAGERGDHCDRIAFYDHHDFHRHMDKGPRRDYEVLVDGAKSGLFGLDLSLCRFDEKSGGYLTIETQWNL
jgi:hypothetical protein